MSRTTMLGFHGAVTLVLLTACHQAPDAPSTSRSSPPAPVAAAPLAAEKVELTERSATAMGTLFTITVTSGTDRERAQQASQAAFSEIRRIDELMTTWNPHSHLSRVNDNAGLQAIAVPSELLDIVERSQQITALSDGKFNIATETLMGLWNHRSHPPRLPEPAELARRLDLLKATSIQVDRQASTIFLARPGMRIGLGGIAKGYAVDRAAQVLRAHQIRDFIIDGGGNLFVSGRKGSERWSIGIRDPRALDRDFARFSADRDCGISTSGDYVKFFIENGIRYHHIIDPSTGYPARGTVSTTVVAPSAELADAWSTALFVLGAERGAQRAAADPRLDALFVDDQMRVRITPRLRSQITGVPNATVAAVGSAE